MGRCEHIISMVRGSASNIGKDTYFLTISMKLNRMIWL